MTRDDRSAVGVDGARVLITGATGGIGVELVREFATHGAHVTATARAGVRLGQLGTTTGVTTIAADLTDPDALRSLVAAAGAVDVLVCNAADNGGGRLDELSEEDVRRVLETNLVAPLVLARSVLPAMLRARRGHLVFVGSVSALAGFPGSSLYSASKFGLRGAAQSLRQDLGGTGVGVSFVSPGFVREAGMLANTLGPGPHPVPTCSPADVARAVIDALDSNPAEVIVGPMSMRVAAHIGAAAPRLGRRLTRWSVQRLGG